MTKETHHERCTSASRCRGAIKHNTLIEMNLYSSKTRRGLGRDWYFADKKIVSVTMSQNQFSELITSMNMGDGIPVTLNFTQQAGTIKGPELESMVEEHEQEVKEHTETISKDAIRPRTKEIVTNPRCSSARFRWAKIGGGC